MEHPANENAVERSLDAMLRDAQRAHKCMRRKLEYTTQNRDRLDLECSDLRTRIDELDERIDTAARAGKQSRSEWMRNVLFAAINVQPSEMPQ